MLARRCAACATALLLLSASALSASDTTFVSQGTRVRVEAPQVSDSRLVGDVSDFRSDTLVILPEDGGSAVSIPWSEIAEIEVSQGKKSNIGKGAWIGALGGLAVGTAIGAAVECSGFDTQAFCTASGMLIGATGGAILGVGTGALIKNERWKKAEFPAPPPVALNVGKDGSVRLAFSLRL